MKIYSLEKLQDKFGDDILKLLLISLGFIFLGIGAIGVILPILPTVPFLLLASFCFAKGSDRFYFWFKSTKLYINNLQSFEKSRSMTLKTKLYILIPVSCLLTISFLMMNNIFGRIIIVILIIIKYYYFIFKINTV